MDSSALSRVGYQQRGGYDARAWSPEPPPEEPAPKPKPKPPADGEKPFKEIPLIPRIATWFQSGARGASDGLSWGGAPEKVLERYPDTKWSSLTAGAALVTALTGGAEIAPVLDRWVATVSGARPTISNGGFLDLHYLLYGSLLDAQRPFAEKPPKDAKEKKTWKTWREDAAFELVRTQRDASAGCAAGSWDPKLDPFGFAGGRIYSTAMAVLALEAPNRFPRVWDPKTKKLGPIDK
jgi:hypothetical protein